MNVSSYEIYNRCKTLTTLYFYGSCMIIEILFNGFIFVSFRYCESRRKVLLDHVHEGYEKDLWEYLELC